MKNISGFYNGITKKKVVSESFLAAVLFILVDCGLAHLQSNLPFLNLSLLIYKHLDETRPELIHLTLVHIRFLDPHNHKQSFLQYNRGIPAVIDYSSIGMLVCPAATIKLGRTGAWCAATDPQ